MVKSTKKSTNPSQAPAPPPRQSNKHAATKVSKKSEKSKTTPTTDPKGPSKSNTQHTDTDAPTTSKQSTLPAVGNAVRHKPPPKTPLGGTWKRVEKKKDQPSGATRKHVRNSKRISPSRSAETKSLTPPHQTSESSHTEEISTFEDTEISSFIQTGIIRYSDVLKSRNVPSSISLRPPLLMKPTVPIQSIGKVGNEAAAIDLEYFPELGQHRTNQNCSSASNNRYPRKAASIAIVENPETPCSPESPLMKTENIENDRIVTQSHSNENVASKSSNQTMIKCHRCQCHNSLQGQWMERAIQNSSTPFSINIPEFNFTQPDINFPRFLMQYEDENYLKAENMALLGLKLALGGSINRHPNYK